MKTKSNMTVKEIRERLKQITNLKEKYESDKGY